MVKNVPANARDIRDVGSSPGDQDPWRRAWQPTPIILAGESHGQRSLMDYFNFYAPFLKILAIAYEKKF